VCTDFLYELLWNLTVPFYTYIYKIIADSTHDYMKLFVTLKLQGSKGLHFTWYRIVLTN